jgi:hypothetical protein
MCLVKATKSKDKPLNAGTSRKIVRGRKVQESFAGRFFRGFKLVNVNLPLCKPNSLQSDSKPRSPYHRYSAIGDKLNSPG